MAQGAARCVCEREVLKYVALGTKISQFSRFSGVMRSVPTVPELEASESAMSCAASLMLVAYSHIALTSCCVCVCVCVFLSNTKTGTYARVGTVEC